jgi:hypothetical protein
MDIMAEATRSLTALNALLARHVWQDEDYEELVYIQGYGLTEPQVEAIVREWFEMVDGKHTDGVDLLWWREDEPVNMSDGSKVYATRACVTFGN